MIRLILKHALLTHSKRRFSSLLLASLSRNKKSRGLEEAAELVNSAVFHLENICIGNIDVMADSHKEFQYGRFESLCDC